MHLFLKLISKKTILSGFLLAMSWPVLCAAQEVSAAPAPPGDSYEFARYALAGMCVLLLIIIIALATVVRSATGLFWEKEKGLAKKGKNTIVSIILLLLAAAPLNVFAEEVQAEVVKQPGMPADIIVLILVVLLELVIILVMVRIVFHFTRIKRDKPEATKKMSFKKLFQKVNQTVPLEEEQSLDMDHDYDGIRELDNKVPTWWLYAFYATILFGGVYLYRMFFSETLPDQFTELQQSKEIAAKQMEAYLKNSADNVDENTVTLVDAAGIAEGAALFEKNCVACHGDKGQGNAVGPNLTDDYWLHKGDLKSIFRTIKYGVPEKGMIAWENNFSPAQIAQLASYIKSLHGTNPPGAKDPQGELYQEEDAPATGQQDSTTVSL